MAQKKSMLKKIDFAKEKNKCQTSSKSFFKADILIYCRPFKTKDSEVTNKSVRTLLPQAICPLEV